MDTGSGTKRSFDAMLSVVWFMLKNIHNDRFIYIILWHIKKNMVASLPDIKYKVKDEKMLDSFFHLPSLSLISGTKI